MALSCCVYIVEDDEAVARSVAALLQLCGYETEHFASADLLLERVGALRPGCLLIDYALPGWNGLAALAELRARGHRWPAIMMTGHDLEVVEGEARRWGVRCVIEKPFDVSLLTGEIAAVAAQLPSGKTLPTRPTRRQGSAAAGGVASAIPSKAARRTTALSRRSQLRAID